MKTFMVVLVSAVLALAALGQRSGREYRAPDPVLASVVGGQLICDPFDGAAGFQPFGDKVWALNWAARERLRTANGARLFREIPREARANYDPAALENLKDRAESLC